MSENLFYKISVKKACCIIVEHKQKLEQTATLIK